jgi:hypothetical protein
MLMSHIPEKQFPEITVHLLRNSPDDNDLIPWKTLLEDPKYFPPQTLDYNPATGRDRPNEEIISMLQRAISSKPYDHGSQLQEIRDDWEKIMEDRPTKANTADIAQAFDQKFQKIEATIGIPGCLRYAQKIRTQLKDWEEASASTVPSPVILSKIDSMMELCYMFSQFENHSAFNGTVHCEANIANFLSQDLKVGYLVHMFVSVIQLLH